MQCYLFFKSLFLVESIKVILVLTISLVGIILISSFESFGPAGRRTKGQNNNIHRLLMRCFVSTSIMESQFYWFWLSSLFSIACFCLVYYYYYYYHLLLKSSRYKSKRRLKG